MKGAAHSLARIVYLGDAICGKASGVLYEQGYLDKSSLRRRYASSAGPRLMSVACGAWRSIRLLMEASPSDRLDRDRDEATRDKVPSLAFL